MRLLSLGRRDIQSIMSGKKVAILATSADKMGDHATGAWSEEITGSYYAFVDAGCTVTIYSVKGGKITIDAGSLSDNFKTENDKRFETSGDIAKLETSAAMATIKADEIDCIYLAGGHGTCVDFPTDEVGALVTDVYAKGKVVGTVCHGSMGLVKAKDGDTLLL